MIASDPSISSADSVSNAQFLFVLLDVHPYWWGRLASQYIKISFASFIEQVCIFCNTYLAVCPNNQLCVSAFHLKHIVLYRSDEERNCDAFQGHSFLTQFNSKFYNFMSNCLSNQTITSGDVSGFIPLLIKNLCIANKWSKTEGLSTVRFLILKVSPTLSSEYLPLMNCLFACQKEKFVIDILSLCFDITALQQMASLSNGLFFKCNDNSKVLHYLMCYFLMPPAYRQSSLILPKSTLLDYKASCFCHKKLVDIGWVCSVCLSVFCAFTPVCITCSSIFKLPPNTISATKKKTKSNSMKNISNAWVLQ